MPPPTEGVFPPLPARFHLPLQCAVHPQQTFASSPTLGNHLLDNTMRSAPGHEELSGRTEREDLHRVTACRYAGRGRSMPLVCTAGRGVVQGVMRPELLAVSRVLLVRAWKTGPLARKVRANGDVRTGQRVWTTPEPFSRKWARTRWGAGVFTGGRACCVSSGAGW